MLIATPYRDFDVRDKSPPRIISEIRKSYANCSPSNFRPKLSGDLLLKCGSERSWWPRRVSVRGGQLHVFTAHGEEGPTSLRLPLRHLSLQAGPLPNSLSLCRGQNIVLTLQTATEKAFDEWVKIIAIELIRQTPLDAIKYLDILTIADCWKGREHSCEQDWNFNNYVTNSNKKENCDSCKDHREQTVTSNDNTTPVKTPEKPIQNVAIIEEKQVEDLLKKCQNVENYVPVKEKLFLFESLSKFGRKVRSTEDVSLKVETGTKRARSLHDLSNLNSHIAVREICKYFENKTDSQSEQKNISCKASRLVNLDSRLNDIYKFRKVFTT